MVPHIIKFRMKTAKFAEIDNKEVRRGSARHLWCRHLEGRVLLGNWCQPSVSESEAVFNCAISNFEKRCVYCVNVTMVWKENTSIESMLNYALCWWKKWEMDSEDKGRLSEGVNTLFFSLISNLGLTCALYLGIFLPLAGKVSKIVNQCAIFWERAEKKCRVHALTDCSKWTDKISELPNYQTSFTVNSVTKQNIAHA